MRSCLFFILFFTANSGIAQIDFSFETKIEHIPCSGQTEITQKVGNLRIDVNEDTIFVELVMADENVDKITYQIVEGEIKFLSNNKNKNKNEIFKRSILFTEQIALLSSELNWSDYKKCFDLNSGYLRILGKFDSSGIGIKIIGEATKEYLPSKSGYLGICKVDMSRRIEQLRIIGTSYFITSVCNIETIETWEIKRLN